MQFLEPSPGPTQRFPNVQANRAKSYFDLFFTETVWEMLVAKTNRYQVQEKIKKPEKYKGEWHEVTKPEMQAFVGILIIMGIARLPSFAQYWRQNVFTHICGITSVFSRERFTQIWRYFHLADNATLAKHGEPGYDKIGKVRTFLATIAANCEKEYRLNREVTIDETMVAHKGRISLKQYMKAKPVKWGIKLWVLSESKTGYVYRFQVYKGKENGQAEKHLARHVVRDLVVNFDNDGHHVYMDNYYSDPTLFIELFKGGIYACGTIRSNRVGFPKSLVVTKREENTLDRGHYRWLAFDQLLAALWFDKRPVYLISTIHPPYVDNNPGQMLEVIRHGPDGTEIHVPCPPAEFDYRQYMRGVDHGDQVMKTHNAARKSRKAWKKLFSYGLEISIMNAFIIEDSFQPHSRPGHCNRTFLDFCLELAAQLIANQSFRKKIGRAPSLPESEIDSLRLNGKSHELS